MSVLHIEPDSVISHKHYHGVVFPLQAAYLDLCPRAGACEFQRVGGEQTIRVSVRVVSATNRDLPALVAQGKFREDLYYRLNVFPVKVVPLRQRKEDITLPL